MLAYVNADHNIKPARRTGHQQKNNKKKNICPLKMLNSQYLFVKLEKCGF